MDNQKRKLSVDSGDNPNSSQNKTDFQPQNTYAPNPASRLNQAEENPQDTPKKDPKEREKTGEESSWKDKTREETDVDDKKKKKGSGFLKKKGPLALIAGGGLGITSLVGMLFSPASLLINIKETMVGKFNYQSSGMEIRSTRLMAGKTSITKGFCNDALTVFCRYSSMSKKQVAKLEKAGVKVNSDATGVLGRVKPESFEFDGIKGEVKADELNKLVRENDAARKALRQGYNSRFASFADEIWGKAKAKLGLKKAKVKLDGDSDDAKLKSMQDQTKLDADDSIQGKAKPGEISEEPDADGNIHKVVKDSDGNIIGDADANGGDLSKLNDGLEVNDGAKAGDELLGSKDLKDVLMGNKTEADFGSTVKSVGGKALKIFGGIDDVCDIYNTLRAIGFAAKTVRAIQLAKYAMLFLNVADQIKAGGNPNPDDVEYLGNILTKEVVATTTKIAIRSATDSFGYKYAAYGDSHKSLMSGLTSQFLAGGGLAGDIIYFTDLLKDKALFSQCKVVSNPWVSAGSLVGTIVLALIPAPGAQQVAWGKLAAQFGKGLAMGAVKLAVRMILPSLLADIVAGKVVGEGTFGELAGDAITSGAGVLNGKIAKYRGLAPLTPKDAVAYQQSMIATEEMYAREERIGRSPFDITSPYTFMGKIVLNLTPHLVRAKTPAGVLSSITAITTNSLKIASSLTVARAASENDFKQCDDEDYNDLDIATDPFCNVVYGIPPDTLDGKDLSPIKVAEYMVNNHHIDLEGKIVSDDYKKYLENCINREQPLGYSGDNGSDDIGEKCVFGKGGEEQKYFYLYHIDETIDKGMSGEDETLNSATDYGFISFYDPVDDYDNVADQPTTKEVEVTPEEDSDWEKLKDQTLEKLSAKPVFQPCDLHTQEKNTLSLALDWLSVRQNFNYFKEEFI